jgi:hypothetical protein
LVSEVCDAGDDDVAALGTNHLMVDLDQERADEADHRDLVVEDPPTSGRRLSPLFNRSIGLFEQILEQ